MATRRLLAFLCLMVWTELCFSAGIRGKVREKRQSKPTYTIDVLVYVDYAFYDNWRTESGLVSSAEMENNLKGYIAYIFQGVNQRYGSITALASNLQVRVSQIVIAKRPEDSPWTESVKTTVGQGRPQVNATAVLEKLEEYVSGSYNTLPDHDHLMLFTRYDLVGESKFTAGLAYVESVCREDGSSVSVVEDDGAAVSEATAAHELGHSLGALHDGRDNACDSRELYAMTGSGANPNVTEADAHKKQNLWIFSTCSLKYFTDSLQKLKNDGKEAGCLLATVTPVGVPQVPDTWPRHPDQQCRHIYGVSSYMCRRSGDSAADVCLKMACYNPNLSGNQCTVNTADTGTCCGQGKWCQRGSCVASPSGRCTSVNDTCPFGDQPTEVKFSDGNRGGRCDDIHAAYCYDAEFRAKCCQRCESARLQLAGCAYGDKVAGCDRTYCSSFSRYTSDCCGTCKDFSADECRDTPGDFTVKYGSQESPQTISDTCPRIVASPERLHLCYNTDFRRSCCQSCEDKWNNDTNCPFGDAGIGCSALTRACSDQERQACCQTCKQFDTTPSPSSTPPPTPAPTPRPTVKEDTGGNNVVTRKPETGVTECGATCGCGAMAIDLAVTILCLVVVVASVF